LKEEADQAFALLHSLSGEALQKALLIPRRQTKF
jgi:hypothetical protein